VVMTVRMLLGTQAGIVVELYGQMVRFVDSVWLIRQKILCRMSQSQQKTNKTNQNKANL
jgi:hypothetical protein